MITFSQRGSFSNTEKYLQTDVGSKYRNVLARIAQQGVTALSANTPLRTGETANAWSYEIEEGDGYISIVWKNSHIEQGVNIAVILQYGHATKNGGFVQGVDYINPALRPIFEALADAAWKEVTAK